MAELPAVVTDVLERADATLMAGWYHAISVQPERMRDWLRSRGLPFVDPRLPEPPVLTEVDRTAEILIDRSSYVFGAIGGAAGFVGAATVPPEWVATTVGVLRLAQRLSVVYGFDPSTDRGEMAMCRALAAAYGVEVPETGPARMRVRDLPSLLGGKGSRRQGIGARLARAMTRSTAWWVAGRITRFVPVLSAGTHAVETRSQIGDTGRKMQAVLRRLAEVPNAIAGPVEEALEVRRR